MGAESYLIGGGKLYFNAGGNTGFRDLGNIVNISLTKAIKDLEHYAAASGKKLLDKKVVIESKIGLKFKLDEFDKDNLDMIFLGDGAADASYSSGSVVDEAITGYIDRVFFTAKGGISAVVITNDAGNITYVADTDYKIIDATKGIIEILSGGAISNGQALKVDYSYAAYTANKIKVGKTFSVDGKARLIFKAAAGNDITWVINNCNLKTEGDIALESEKWADADFTLDVLADSSDAAQPYGYILID
ncbi:MAG: hypothetical protein QY317_16170 [Candidatus Jettenia caeni]|nr:MAG: hypothetical protein QY317_16170 [Candidatus Jettenia caeni]